MTDKLSFADGLHDITSEQYHGSDGVSRSQLLDMNTSPFHYWYKHVSGAAEPFKTTNDMAIGSALHTLVLEPHLFNKQFAITPTCDRRTKEGKSTYNNFLLLSEGKTLLSEDDYFIVRTMAINVMNDELAGKLLGNAANKFEQSIYWTDANTGLQFKARPDVWRNNAILDLKTTKNASFHAFRSSAIQYGYYLQAAMCKLAVESIGESYGDFVIIAVEKTAPFALGLYTISEDAINYGLAQFKRLSQDLAACINRNAWPSYSMRELDVPGYLTANQSIVEFE
jgi:hypothetical protein